MRNFGRAALILGIAASLASPALAQPPGGFGRGMMMGGGNGAQLLGNEGVQKELKMSEEQISKAKDFASKLQEQRRETFQGFQDLSQEERQEKMREFNKKTTEEGDK